MSGLRFERLIWWRRGFAVAFFAAATYHAAAVLGLGAASSAATGRHALFVVINLAVALGFLRPPPGFALIVALLCGQQLLSHGATLLREWQGQERVDWPSVAVLIAMPLAVIVAALAHRHEPRSPSL